LDEKVKGTIWEYHPILDKKLKYKIAENSHSYIQTVTIDSRPSIEYFRAYEHNLERSLSQVFTLTFEDMSSIYNDALGVTEEFNEFELEIKIPDRHQYFDLNDPILKHFDYEIIGDYLKLNITEYDKFAIPTIKVHSEPNYSSYRTYIHDLKANTNQDFILSNFENNLDITLNYAQFNEIEYQKEILNFMNFFDLNEKIRPQMFNENLYNQYGLLEHDHVLTKELLNKILLDRFDDINIFNVVVEEPQIERIYDINAYFLEERGNGKFTQTSTIYSDITPSFIDASIAGGPFTNEHERDLIIWNDRQSFSLANL